jgi:hypothetical protein
VEILFRITYPLLAVSQPEQIPGAAAGKLFLVCDFFHAGRDLLPQTR